ncbi:class I SAM-dependent methyltransferase [Actinoplanes sp. NEAU-A12]|uniref:Class I SAM-dependent methyltransferase n=1 Tax=Actinoplanes sandaracinus TaxID=3045177 RepID=A0ABT6WBS6_9ACTN|nr:class I SAM-dependent methyltransferase [Actinoplanes sandaracinus]MDI6097170.1 class I SAM-dependent methyltransferase [Actinoplanes sandaracinus]
MGRLLSEAALHGSSVVANCAMNRERQLAGVNSYARVLGFDPVDWLAATRIDGADDTAGADGTDGTDGTRGPAWLDLCCGSGRALVQAAEQLPSATIVGVDLVDAFVSARPGVETSGTGQPADAGHLAGRAGGTGGTSRAEGGVSFVVAPVEAWEPDRAFDLITCVHGLHYVGDKLAVLARMARCLRPGGRFVADLDLDGIRLADGQPAGRRLVTRLRGAGLAYDARRRRISCTGPVQLDLPYAYLGADDRAGPNYTGQPAVHSFYDLL